MNAIDSNNVNINSNNSPMAARYNPKFRFVLTDKQTGKFPKISSGLTNEKQLTDSLECTYVFDDRDNPLLKKGYYNAVYRGLAEFEPFIF